MMTSNYELQVLVHIIQTGQLSSVIEWGIEKEDFLAEETKILFERILDIYLDPNTGGTVIGPSLANELFSNIPMHLYDPHVRLDYLCKELRTRRITRELESHSIKQATLVGEGKVREALELMGGAVHHFQQLEFAKNVDIYGSKGFKTAREQYIERKAGVYKGVTTWPWPQLTHLIGPVEKDDYVILYGRPKNLKTWVLMYMLYHVLLVDSNTARPVVYTKEMSPESLYNRLASILAQVLYDGVRRGGLDDVNEILFFSALDQVIEDFKESDRLLVLSAKDVTGRDTVSWFSGKAKKHKATAGFIDGLYLMTPHAGAKQAKNHEKVLSVSRETRQVCFDVGMPIFATIQANRGAVGNDRAETGDLGGSDAFGQDATALFRVIKDKKPAESMEADTTEEGNPEKGKEWKQTLSLPVAGSREWDLYGFKIYGIPSTNFGWHSVMTESQALAAEERETKAAEEKKKKERERIVRKPPPPPPTLPPAYARPAMSPPATTPVSPSTKPPLPRD